MRRENRCVGVPCNCGRYWGHKLCRPCLHFITPRAVQYRLHAVDAASFSLPRFKRNSRSPSGLKFGAAAESPARHYINLMCISDYQLLFLRSKTNEIPLSWQQRIPSTPETIDDVFNCTSGLWLGAVWEVAVWLQILKKGRLYYRGFYYSVSLCFLLRVSTYGVLFLFDCFRGIPGLVRRYGAGIGPVDGSWWARISSPYSR